LPAPGLKIRLDADKEISSSMILIWILVCSYYLSRRDVSIRMTSQVVPAQIREGRVSSRSQLSEIWYNGRKECCFGRSSPGDTVDEQG